MHQGSLRNFGKAAEERLRHEQVQLALQLQQEQQQVIAALAVPQDVEDVQNTTTTHNNNNQEEYEDNEEDYYSSSSNKKSQSTSSKNQKKSKSTKNNNNQLDEEDLSIFNMVEAKKQQMGVSELDDAQMEDLLDDYYAAKEQEMITKLEIPLLETPKVIGGKQKLDLWKKTNAHKKAANNTHKNKMEYSNNDDDDDDDDEDSLEEEDLPPLEDITSTPQIPVKPKVPRSSSGGANNNDSSSHHDEEDTDYLIELHSSLPTLAPFEMDTSAKTPSRRKNERWSKS